MKNGFRLVLCVATLGLVLPVRATTGARRLIPTTSVRRSFTATEIAQSFRNGRLLAKAKAGVDAAALRAAEAKIGAQLERTFATVPRLEVLTFTGGTTVKAQAARLMATGLYEYAEPDRVIRATVVPNDTYFTTQWSLNNTTQSGGIAGADIKAETGWAIDSTSPSTIVAVIDSGIRVTHEDLAANIWKNPSPGQGGYTGDINGINATFPSTEPGNGDPNDDFFHGTMVAGIIGAVGNNSIGIAGVTWSVQLMALKFISADGFGPGSGEIACIDYAIAHKAQIINGSFGDDQPSEAEFDAIEAAREAGIIVVVAAGNDGINADAGYAFPAGYLLDNIVTVAASNESDMLSSYSNFGSGLVDLAAPGDDIGSTINTSDGSYATGSGTSFAAPHVAGVLALLHDHFPSDSYRQLINRLLIGTAPLASFSGVVQSGGRLDMNGALSSTANTPFNDTFAKRATLAGSIIQVRSSNVGATLDTGEATTLAGVPVGASLWWTWTAPQTGTYYLDTVGSTFDTVVGVFTGSAVSSLSTVASNDDATTGSGTSHLALSAVAGTNYQIEVAGKNSATGIVALRIVAPPPNDNFAAAQTVTGDPATGCFSMLGVTLYGTTEAGEPNPTGNGGGNSVWYKWTAPVSGPVELAAYSAELDMVAAVYTGTSVSSLTLVGASNNESATNTDSLVPFTAAAGQTYYFQLDNTGTTGGNFTVLLNDAAWQFPTRGAITTTPAVGNDGTIYLSSTDGTITALNLDGSPKWSYQAGGYFDNVSPALTPGGNLVAGASDNNLYCLNAATGALVWKFAAATAISTSAAIGSDGTAYFHDDLNLYAISSTGIQKWSAALNGHSYASPVVGTNGTIYVGTPAGELLFNANGNLLQTVPTTGPVDGAAAIDADGTVYVPTVDGHVLALNPDGSSKWSVSVSYGESFTSSPVIAPDGSVIVAADSLYRLSPISGATLATVSLPSSMTLSAPVVAADGTLYVGTADYNLYSIAAGSNQVTRVGASAYYILGSPVLANGYLYFGSLDAKLYAFKVGDTLAPTPWPMSGQGPALAGRGVGTLAITGSSPSQSVVTGYPLVLSATASGGPAGGPYQPVTFQWYKNGAPIAGATSSTYTVASASAGDAGNYYVAVAGPGGVFAGPQVGVAVAAQVPGRLINLAARAQVGTGDNILIAGFVVAGTGSKNILVRGVGPTLGSFGVTGFLAAPLLSVDNGAGTPVGSNAGWGGAPALSAAFTQVGAFGLTAGSLDTALLAPFPAGAYTALVSGANSTTGVALAEVYDADTGTPSTRLVNLSVRAPVGTGSSILIAGFVISGNVPKTVLIRGIGPGLTTFGVSGALQEPALGLYTSAGSLVEANYEWSGEPRLSSAMAAVGAFSLNPQSPDSVLLVTLPPGAYTAQLSGVNGTTGVGLIEVYEVQ